MEFCSWATLMLFMSNVVGNMGKLVEVARLSFCPLLRVDV